MVDFDHLGYDLNRCGGVLDGIQNFIQTCLHHTVVQVECCVDIFSYIFHLVMDFGTMMRKPMWVWKKAF